MINEVKTLATFKLSKQTRKDLSYLVRKMGKRSKTAVIEALIAQAAATKI